MNTPVRNYFDTLVSNHHYCTAKRQKCLQFTCQIMLPQFSVGMLGLDFMLIWLQKENCGVPIQTMKQHA